MNAPDKPRALDRMRRCPECGEYMIHIVDHEAKLTPLLERRDRLEDCDQERRGH